MKKERADKVLVEKGLAETRQRAQALIMAGLVSGPAGRIEKAGQPVDPAAELTIAKPLPFVSRGGFKLEQALDDFDVSPQGLVCADIGSSTGGFTDCLLQRGAARVFAVDVDIRQLDDRLRRDPRVVTVQKNARNLVAADFPAAPAERPALYVMDVSFISILKILPALRGILLADVAALPSGACNDEKESLVAPSRFDVGASLKQDEVATHSLLGSVRNDGENQVALAATIEAMSLRALPDGEDVKHGLRSVATPKARNDEKISIVAPSRLDVGASFQEGQEERLPSLRLAGAGRGEDDEASPRQGLATTDKSEEVATPKARNDEGKPILLTLIKPQFEAGRGQVGKKGIVREPALHAEILARVAAEAGRTGFALRGLVLCRTHGRTGNREFFARWEPGGMEPPAADVLKWIEDVISHETD